VVGMPPQKMHLSEPWLMAEKSPETLDNIEITRRMEDGLRRALSTPHKPTKKLVGKSLKGGAKPKPSKSRGQAKRG
jgi:hypothetical protein